MAENTKIQWTDHTVNFWTGCIKVSPGCKFCYMFRDQERYGKNPTDVLKVSEKTINKVLKAAKPGDKIFTCSWSDFFIEEADQWRDWAWDIIRANPQYHWQILTKRPERIKDCLPKDWGKGWPQVWLGVSVESQKQIDRIPALLKAVNFSQGTNSILFLSIEPMISAINFKYTLDLVASKYTSLLSYLDWVIVGGESGNDRGKYKYRECAIEWIVDVVTQSKEAETPVFVKQMGTYIAKEFAMRDRSGGDINEFIDTLQVREFPNYKIAF